MSTASVIPSASLAAEAIVLSILCIVAVALRFTSRYASKTQLMWDDWLIIPALSVTLGLAVVIMIQVRTGGFDAPAGPPAGFSAAGPPPGVGLASGSGPPPGVAAMIHDRMQQAALVKRLESIFQCLQILSLGFLKASVLFFYRRLFVTGQRNVFDWVTRILLGLTLVWAVSFFIAGIASCPARLVAGTTPALSDPINFLCVGNARMNYFYGPFAFIVTDVVTDFAVLAVPLPMVWRLQMPKQRKLALSGVFLLGGLACASSVLRLAKFAADVSLSQGPATPFVGGGSSGDPKAALSVVGFASLMSFYSMLESGLALIAACLPTLRFLFTKKGWKSIRSHCKWFPDRWSVISEGSTLRSRGRKREGSQKESEARSCSERPTVVRTPSPVAYGSVAEKYERPESQARLAAPQKALVADVDVASLEEGRIAEARSELGREGSERDTAWLRPTVEASRQAQV